ncbi:MAG: MFS transporter [Acidimicrobiia bacterium]
MPEPLFTRAFVSVFAANTFMELAWSLFLHFPGYLQDLGADEVQIGILVGVTALASIVIRPWIGQAMDVRGRRQVIIAGNVLHVAVLALYLTVNALGPWIYIVRILHGLASATLFTSLFTYAADVVPVTRRTQGIAIFGISGLMPIGLGGILGDGILAIGDFTTLFVTAMGLAVAALLVALPLQDVHGAEVSEERRGFWAAFGQRDLRPLWLAALVFALALATFFTFLKTFVIETGFGSVGLFFGVYTATAIGLRMVAADLPDRLGHKRVMFPAFGMMAAGFIVLSWADSALDMAIAGFLSGVGHGYVFPIMFGMVVTRARPSERGSASAIFTAVFDVGTLIGGPMFGLAIRFGDYRAMWWLAAGLVVVGAAAFAWWDRSRTSAGVLGKSPAKR